MAIIENELTGAPPPFTKHWFHDLRRDPWRITPQNHRKLVSSNPSYFWVDDIAIAPTKIYPIVKSPGFFLWAPGHDEKGGGTSPADRLHICGALEWRSVTPRRLCIQLSADFRWISSKPKAKPGGLSAATKGVSTDFLVPWWSSWWSEKSPCPDWVIQPFFSVGELGPPGPHGHIRSDPWDDHLQVDTNTIKALCRSIRASHPRCVWIFQPLASHVKNHGSQHGSQLGCSRTQLIVGSYEFSCQVDQRS